MKLVYLKSVSASQKNLFEESRLCNIVEQEFYYTELSFLYYNEYHNGKYTDARFIVFDNELPVLVFAGTLSEQTISYFHFPFKVFVDREAGADKVNEAYKYCIGEINNLVKKERAQKLIFISDEFLVGEYFKFPNEITIRHFCKVNLEQSVEQLYSNIRKRFKPLINWGKTNLSITVFDESNISEEVFYAFKKFHILTSGKQTRNDRTWDLQLEMILKEEAFLVIGYHENKMVSGLLILCGKNEAYYGVGVNDRELIAANLPISHFAMYSAVLHAKKMGLKYFNLNEIDAVENDEKKNNISKFKAGFSNCLYPSAEYLISVQHEQ